MTDAERHPGDDVPTTGETSAGDHSQDIDAGAGTGPTAADRAAPGPATPDDPATEDGTIEAASDAAADNTAEIDAPDSDAAASDTVDLAVAAEQDPRSREELLAELWEAEARRDEYLDDLRRARAEFENFRRRTMREGATQRDVGKAAVLTGLLEVLDDLDRTLEAAENSADASLAKGVGLVAGKLVQALQGEGLERVDQTGVAFDPNQHEAVQEVPADEPGGQPTVAQVLRPGYRVGDRVLRPAMVVVEQ